MNKERLVPQLRFKGFEGEWEKKTFRELADIKRGASPRPIKDPKWFDKNSDIGWLRISDVTKQNGKVSYIEQRISNLGAEKTRVLTTPHLILSIAATIGEPAINYVKTGVHDGFLIFYNPKFELMFGFQWLRYFKSFWQQYGQPGSQVNLNSDIVNNQDVILPLREEQQKIGSFFEKMDKLIELYQGKTFLNKKYKKSLFQHMIPKSDVLVPKARFNEFKDLFYNKVLKDVIESELKGKAQAKMDEGDSTYLDTEYLNGGEKRTVDSPTNVDYEDVLILWDGSQAGTVYHGFKGALGSTLKSYKPKESGDYLYLYLKENQQKIYHNYRSPNIPHVIKTFTSEFSIVVPSLPEQQKIGQLFQKLDQEINLYEQKIEQLKQLKKGYLQKLFC